MSSGDLSRVLIDEAMYEMEEEHRRRLVAALVVGNVNCGRNKIRKFLSVMENELRRLRRDLIDLVIP